MQKSEILSRITPIFQDILEDDELELTDDLTAADVEAWDSLSNVRLIVAVEQDLGIKFNMAAISDIENVGELIEIIEKLTG